MKIAFRVDASVQIGTGHVMRCLTLAKALREQGAECLFLSRDHKGNLNEILKSQSFDVRVLPSREEPPQRSDQPVLAHSHWLSVSWQTDAQQTIEAIGDGVVDWLVIDHYALDERWELRIRQCARKIMVIDDLADRRHDCELLVDQNQVENFEHRYDLLIPFGCTRLLGPKYALIQPEYAEMRLRTPPRIAPVRRIFAYFGGSDLHNLTELAISAFLNLQQSDLQLDVVINSTSPNVDSVRSLVAGHSNITLHESVPSLAPLMAKADLAIGAGGATTWERCCLGLPSLVVTVAENQRLIVDSLSACGLIRWLGPVENLTIDKLTQIIKNNLKESALESWSKSCTQLVDGLGLLRIAEILRLSNATTLQARLATLVDEDISLACANAGEANENPFERTQISNAEHRTWFYSKLKSVDTHKFFIIETETGYPLGQVRFEKLAQDWQISCTLILPGFDYELLMKALAVAIKKFRNIEPGLIVFGKIVLKNERSTSVLEIPEFEKETSGSAIAFCSDRNSWINDAVARLIAQLLESGRKCLWTHNAQELVGGDLCFYLSYERLVSSQIRSKFKNNLVIHASELPKGRGWSPASWLILEGKDRIPVTLFEAVDEVDAGQIYDQRWISVHKTDLIRDWQAKLAEATIDLISNFIKNYPGILLSGKLQEGDPSYYLRRKPEDSRLNPQKTILEQFELLQIADNERYPVFFEFLNTKFYLKVFKGESASN